MEDDRFFSRYDENNHYRLFLRFKTEGIGHKMQSGQCSQPACACALGGGDLRDYFAGLFIRYMSFPKCY